jgi:tetratricopeptide (TPR) repeat protein
LLIGAGVVTCSPQQVTHAAPPPLLDVEFTGCVAVRAGPICEMAGDGELTFWLPVPAGTPIAARVDTKEAAAERAVVEQGVQLRVRVNAGAHELQLTAFLGSEARAFRLPIEPTDVVPEIASAETLRRALRLDEAEASLAAPLHATSASVRARAIGKLARIDLGRGRAVEAVQHFHEAIALDHQTGRRSDELADRLALSFTLNAGRQFTAARAALEPLTESGAEIPEARALVPFYAACIASDTGDLRSALRLLRDANAGARRLGLDMQLADVLEIEAEVLRLLGRRAEAEAAIVAAGDALGANATPCRRAAHLINSSVVQFDDGADPTRIGAAVLQMEAAISLYRKDCPKPALLANALTNLAEGTLALGDVTSARALLIEARLVNPALDIALEAGWMAIDGRLALMEGDALRALAFYEDLGKRAELALIADARWQAALGRAQALEALGRVERARDAYAEAERLLDDAGGHAPLGDGKTTFLGKRENLARQHVDFLARRGDPDAAMVARRSRARILGAMRWTDRIGALDSDHRERWEAAVADYRRGREELDAESAADWKLAVDKLSEARVARLSQEGRLRSMLDQELAVFSPTLREALSQPSPGEVFLVYHPTDHGWIGFAVTSQGTATRRLGEINSAASPAELANRLLVPFRAQIGTATRLRVLPYGLLERIDFHALPFEGKPLVTWAPVEYGVDLPVRPSAPSDRAVTSALVVADPHGDLPLARVEAEKIASMLRQRAGLEPLLLEGHAATHLAVRDAIEQEQTGLLHYAGHGIFEGRDGWQSGFPLAAGGWLSVGDVLVLKRAPDLVLLSGCETARAPSGSSASGLGLAQAFIVAGSRAVIASPRPVDDALAERLMTAVYRPFRPHAALDLAASLREAELAVRQESPEADWAAFRVLVP